MKKLYISFYLAVSIMFFFSCEDFLDVTSPSSLSATDFWNTSSDAEQGVAAVYDAAQSAFEANFLRYGEFRADNFQLIDRPSSDIEQLLNNGLTLDTAGSDWSVFYQAIAHANVAIQNIPDVPAFDGKDDLLAQALTLRSLFYFYLVRTWGDVPKVTEPVQDIQQDLNVTRSPASEIFQEIILPDLDLAEQLIARERRLNHISRGAILALKAHVYAWPGNHQDYATVRDAISQLEDFGYTLETTENGWVENLFQIFSGPQDSDEIVFALAWDFETDGSNGGITTLSNSSPHYNISDNLRQDWNAAIPGDDFRRDVSLGDPDHDDPLRFNILTKYVGGDWTEPGSRGDYGATADFDLVFYRLSGLLLLKAEAENYLNNPSEALALINRIRTARGVGLVDETITDQTTIRDLVLDERRFELLGEGHRYWDLVRNNIVLQVMDPINGMNDASDIFWPVSQNVMNRNPAITQTEGY